MEDVLTRIVAHKKVEIEQLRATKSYAAIEREVMPLLATPVQGGSMRDAIANSGSGIIAEFKRRSPSRGWINEDADAAVVPLAYQEHGAAAISVLTDEHFFGGHDRFIAVARQSGVDIPVLYKNFVIDEYQLLQARICGASAVLLIAACLSQADCRRLLAFAHDLGLEVLLEMHGEPEIEYAALNPDLYGVNNRNLGSFVTDINNSFIMANLLPDDVVKVSESGISNPETTLRLRDAGYSGFLIGENFMKTDNPGISLEQFIAKL